MVVHALITGPITGRIPVEGHPDGHVDVTPEVLYFDHDSDETPPGLQAVADAIDVEHRIRGTHPGQVDG